MIKGISSNGPYISVRSAPNHYINMSTPSAGMMRYNGIMACVEIYDGSYWKAINNYEEIGLTPQANEILDWAKKKMEEERNYTNLAFHHPAVVAALENLKRAEEQLKTTIHLSKEHEKTAS